MFHPLALSAAAALLLTGQSAEDIDAATRARLADSEKQVMADLRDPAFMADTGRATLLRLTIEANWELCAATEAGAAARLSERPARLLAEAALTTCLHWEEALRLALEKGAYPYLGGGASREDMVTRAGLEARDAALARILRWRGGSPATAKAPSLPAKPEPIAPLRARPIPPTPQAPPPAQEAAAPEGEEAAIVVVGQLKGGCRVRFADRTLTERQLALKAREWAAAGTRLRLIRPAGADYKCLSQIVWHLGEYGIRKFVFVEPSDTSAAGPTPR